MKAEIAQKVVIDTVRASIQSIQQENNISKSKFQKIVFDYFAEEGIPLWIFHNDQLSTLEAITKFLHENKNMRFVEIARKLNRSDKTIWVTYRKATWKMPESLCEFNIALPLHLKSMVNITIPISVFANRLHGIGVLQNLVVYLKDTFSVTYHDIALIMERNDRTIWTSYAKAKAKEKKKGEKGEKTKKVKKK